MRAQTALALAWVLTGGTSWAADSASWQDRLRQAEPIYARGDFQAALPFYVQATEVMGSAPAADQIQCLRYLGDDYLKLNQSDKALAVYQRCAGIIAGDDVGRRVDNLNDQAVCYVLEGDYVKADSLCRAALKLSEPSSAGELKARHIRTQAHLAYTNYLRGKYEAAIEGFLPAQKLLETAGMPAFQSLTLQHKIGFATAGSYYHLKRFAESAAQFKRVYEADLLLFGSNSLQTGWAMLALSDTLDRIGEHKQSQEWYSKAIFNFRRFNRDRIVTEFTAAHHTPAAELSERINKCVFGKQAQPDTENSEKPLCTDPVQMIATHDPCSVYVRPFTDAPGRVWLNPLIPQKGIVIGIHGLSLNHSSYDALAVKLADAGYTTIAFDVRGFGTYRQALGAEQIDFDGCLQDLRSVVVAIRQDNPGLPLFVLGESMGGAIAVQFAAQNESLVDGLIASVPAGKRFKDKRTAVKVAVKFLENKDKPFNIGADVIKQATSDPKLQQQWANDPLTRTDLTPRELLNFQMMLNRNVDFARQLRKTPVIVFQGLGDGLVKPQATYDLFQAIGSKDKSLTMVGNAEHLIFEEGCFTPAVLYGLVGWMDAHLSKNSLPNS